MSGTELPPSPDEAPAIVPGGTAAPAGPHAADVTDVDTEIGEAPDVETHDDEPPPVG
jgi:hypothetical protein